MIKYWKILVCGVLLSESKVLLLDEATSALDSKTEMRIFDKLLTYSNKTLIMISHNLNLINKCDLIIDLDKKWLREIIIKLFKSKLKLRRINKWVI